MTQTIDEVVSVEWHCNSKVDVTVRGTFRVTTPYGSEEMHIQICTMQLTQAQLERLLLNKTITVPGRLVRFGDEKYHLKGRACQLAPDASRQHCITSASLTTLGSQQTLVVWGVFCGAEWSGADDLAKDTVHKNWALPLEKAHLAKLATSGRLGLPPLILRGGMQGGASVYAGTWVVDPSIIQELMYDDFGS